MKLNYGKFQIFIFLILLSASCSKSSDPEVTPLIPLVKPQIFGAFNSTFITPSPTVVITGTCDSIAHERLYYKRFNEDVEKLVPGGCRLDNTFEFTEYLPKITTVSVFGERLFLRSDPAFVTVNFVKPASSVLRDFVSTSASPDASYIAPVFYSTMPHTYIGSGQNIHDLNIQTHATGIVYAED